MCFYAFSFIYYSLYALSPKMLAIWCGQWYNIQVMRIDKFLKVSRIIKRRTVAAEACDGGKVVVNGRSVKPAYTLEIGDVVEVKLGSQPIKFVVKSLNDKVGKEDAVSLYEIQH